MTDVKIQKFKQERPYAKPEAAARKLIEIARLSRSTRAACASASGTILFERLAAASTNTRRVGTKPSPTA
jgi:hypothetical protein